MNSMNLVSGSKLPVVVSYEIRHRRVKDEPGLMAGLYK